MKAEIKVGDVNFEADVVVGSEGERGIDIGKLRDKTGIVTLDPAFVNTASTKSAITFIDGDKGILRYRGIPIEQLAEQSTFVETAYLLIYGHLPNERRADALLHAAHASLDDPRGHEALLRRLPVDGAPDGRAVRHDLLAVELLPGRARREQHATMIDITIARLISKVAHDRGLRVQEVDRPAVRLPEELAQVRGQLPAHDVQRPGRALRGRPRDRARAQPAPHPARRPRAELLDVDGAPRRLVQGEPVRGHRGRHLRALGPAARRRQPGSDRDARGHPGRRRRREEVRAEGQGQELQLPAHGLRPPRLQELRSAREDHQGRGRQGARQARHQRTRCSTSPSSSKKPRSRTTTSSSASSTRTSTSTRASSTARSASPRTCSP